jgi:hypothetical protein
MRLPWHRSEPTADLAYWLVREAMISAYSGRHRRAIFYVERAYKHLSLRMSEPYMRETEAEYAARLINEIGGSLEFIATRCES